MIDELFTQEPFYEKKSFIGVIEKGDLHIGGLQIQLQYSLIKENTIDCWVLGVDDTFDKLRQLMTPPYDNVKLIVENAEQQRIVISSDSVYLKNLHGRPYYQSQNAVNVAYKAATLDLRDLKIEYKIDEKIPERHLTYFLCGSRTYWPVHMARERNINGDIKNEYVDIDNEIHHDRFEIKFKLWHYFDDVEKPIKYEAVANIMAIEIVTKENEEAYNDERFINDARTFVEDYLAIYSFISKSRISWFGYQLETNKSFKQYYRRIVEVERRDTSFNQGLVEYNEFGKFSVIAMENIGKLKEHDMNLHMPILYYISSFETGFIEDKFALSFLALEKIKDMYAVKENIYNIMDDSEFNLLKVKIKDCLAFNIVNKNVKDKINAKIKELQRTPLKAILFSMFERYNIQWSDLYPQQHEFTLARTRDKLFHTNIETDDEIVKESIRLQSLLERLLLSMLGWHDFHKSPEMYTIEWLNGNRP